MKYLNSYGLFESIDKSMVLRYAIDMNMIENLKDMSLEYLDKGMTLYIYVSTDSISDTVFIGKYNHKEDAIQKFDYELISRCLRRKDKFVYYANLNSSKRVDNITDSHFDEVESTIELVKSMKNSYPDVDIRCPKRYEAKGWI